MKNDSEANASEKREYHNIHILQANCFIIFIAVVLLVKLWARMVPLFWQCFLTMTFELNRMSSLSPFRRRAEWDGAKTLPSKLTLLKFSAYEIISIGCTDIMIEIGAGGFAINTNLNTPFLESGQQLEKTPENGVRVRARARIFRNPCARAHWFSEHACGCVRARARTCEPCNMIFFKSF